MLSDCFGSLLTSAIVANRHNKALDPGFRFSCCLRSGTHGSDRREDARQSHRKAWETPYHRHKILEGNIPFQNLHLPTVICSCQIIRVLILKWNGNPSWVYSLWLGSLSGGQSRGWHRHAADLLQVSKFCGHYIQILHFTPQRFNRWHSKCKPLVVLSERYFRRYLRKAVIGIQACWARFDWSGRRFAPTALRAFLHWSMDRDDWPIPRSTQKVSYRLYLESSSHALGAKRRIGSECCVSGVRQQ